MHPSLSVVVCTHNPRGDYFARTLAALEAQTLPHDLWEMLVVDNVSTPSLADRLPTSRPEHLRMVVEENLGLTQARLRGIAETRGEMIVFVDDDNVLAPDYLEQTLAIAAAFPLLGAWGGTIAPEFEIEPPQWMLVYRCCLALRQVTKDEWSCYKETPERAPYGAGLCVRRVVAKAYRHALAQNPTRTALDRKGISLASAGDTDLALTACDIGLGYGLFARLSITHLIPKERLTLPYFERLLRGVSASGTILRHIRHPITGRDPQSRLEEMLKRYRRWRMAPTQRRLEQAMDLGREDAYRALGI